MSSEGKLWQFSLQFYSKSGVKDACLTLQDDHNADVNLILFLLYQGSIQKRLSQETIQQIDDKTRSFRERVIQPIRDLRKALKGKEYSTGADSDSLYKNMLHFELSAEKFAQAHLDTIVFDSYSGLKPLEATTNNLYTYTNLLEIPEPNLAVETLLSHIEN